MSARRRMSAKPFWSDPAGRYSIYVGDCRKVLPKLKVEARAVVTSPPYAEQRDGFYQGVPEDEYPEGMASVFAAATGAIAADARLLVNIPEHVSTVGMSDYVHRTRMRLREEWYECDELVWYKPSSAPVGDYGRPRRSWERILWFSLTNRPYCDPRGNGKQSKFIGFKGSKPEWVRGVSTDLKSGVSKSSDVVSAGSHDVRRDEAKYGSTSHQAVFPVRLAQWLIAGWSAKGDTIIDPFLGSGSTMLAAIESGRKCVGIELSQKSAVEARDRVARRLRKRGLFDLKG